MLERDSRSHAPSGVFSSSSDGDSVRGASSLASEKTTSSSHVFKSSNSDSHCNELCIDDTIIDDKTTGFNHNPSTDPLGEVTHVTHADGNLNFFENSEVKDSSDFLYSSWLEIENFEDVDRMFRSCDSTFGLEACKEDESSWFLSSDSIGGTSEIMNPDFKFSCPETNSVENLSMNHDYLRNNSSNDADMMNAPVSDCPWISEKPDLYVSFLNEPAIANGEEGFVSVKMNEHQNLVKLQDDSYKAFSYVCKLQPKHVLDSDSCNCLQSRRTCGHPDSSTLCGLTSVNPAFSAVKTETNELTSPSTRDSSYASNLLASRDGSYEPPPPLTIPTGIGKRDKAHNRRGSPSPVESNIKPTDIVLGATSNNPDPMEKEAQYPRDKSENHSHIEDFHLIPAELASSNIQECSISSVNDVSLEAATFRQLQLVTDQLDLRTKTCIRDSLYRLARSAEQRHSNHANMSSNCGDGRDASGALIADGEKNFLDIETDTNPIDRSVAHLLFHRPSESSHGSARD